MMGATSSFCRGTASWSAGVEEERGKTRVVGIVDVDDDDEDDDDVVGEIVEGRRVFELTVLALRQSLMLGEESGPSFAVM
jgi:hypothetical protein